MTLLNLQQGDMLEAANVQPMPGNEIAPPLILGDAYPFQKEHICGCGEKHFDVGLLSKVNFVTCYKCEEKLPGGDKIHWCHASRFVRPQSAIGTEEIYAPAPLNEDDEPRKQPSPLTLSDLDEETETHGNP